MKLRHFNIGLKSDDYLISNLEGAEFPFSVDTIVADFNFQSYFFSHFIERELKKLKHELADFNSIMVRGRKGKIPLETVFLKHLKSIDLETNFDEERYHSLYPFVNTYPLKRPLLKKLENEHDFSMFLYDMTKEALGYVDTEEIDIPVSSLFDILESFKNGGFINEWIFKEKVFKKHALKGVLYCKSTCNYFSLELRIQSKEGDELFRKEILKSLPNAIIYKSDFKDLVIKNDSLIVLKEDSKSILYRLPLSQFSR